MSDADLKVPPNSLDAERAVLGALLLAGSNEQTRAALLRAGNLTADFYLYGHAVVFTAIRELAEAGAPVDVLTVHDRLNAAGAGTTLGGISGIAALIDTVSGPAQIDHFATVVRNLALARRIHGVALQVAGSVYGIDWQDVPEYVTSAVAALGAAAQSGDAGKPDIVHVGELVQSVFDGLANSGAGQAARIVPYGIPDLDAELGGSLVGLVETFGADTGAGKSTLMLQMALHTAQTEPVLIITLEDTRENWTARALAQESGVPSRTLLFDAANIPVGKWPHLTMAASTLTNGGLWFRRGRRPDLASIRMTLALAKSRLPNLRLVVIDYVQRITARAEGFRASDRVAELQHIMEMLEQDAAELGLAIRLVSQLNRVGRRDSSRPPHPGDMKSSGALEEVAKRCTFLWRPDPAEVSEVEVGFGSQKTKMPLDPGMAFFVVGKDGHGGRLGCAPLVWNAAHERYSGITNGNQA